MLQHSCSVDLRFLIRWVFPENKYFCFFILNLIVAGFTPRQRKLKRLLCFMSVKPIFCCGCQLTDIVHGYSQDFWNLPFLKFKYFFLLFFFHSFTFSVAGPNEAFFRFSVFFFGPRFFNNGIDYLSSKSLTYFPSFQRASRCFELFKTAK